ncbi:MAG: hypothetical protein QNJ40_15410 [Xanthomonadales bacterium]|nr:hypothetical protein [Xanthomonadales bacterium]
MPFHLEPIDFSDELRGYASVLIVSCPVCPPISLATDTDSPFMELFKHGIKTPAYEAHLSSIQEGLERDGIKTGVFTSHFPCAAACLWTSGQRNRLRKHAAGYDAALVMGCESTRYTVADTLKETDCDVILGMELVGVTNAVLKFRFPQTLTLDNLDRVRANERVEQATSAT